jgi:osmoprotectant transport system substrate-binding protein
VNLRRTLSIALAPLVVLAAACGDDDDTDTADVASTATEDTATGDTAAAAPDTTGAAATTAGSDTTAAPATTAGGDGTTATSAAGGGTAPMGSGSIVVGSADFPESQLLAQIYGQSLAAAGFDVSYQLGIGAREIYFDAVESGEVDLVPEYTNSLLSFVLRRDDPEATPDAANVEEQVAALGEVLPEGLEVLTPSTAEDKDVIVCTAETAEEFSLTNLSDLAGVLDQITLGAPPEFEGRSPFGLAGFEQVLGAPPVGEFVPLDVGAVADALAGGQIDCGNLFSTMSVITTEGFVALEDDQTLVPNEAVLPLVRSEVVDEALTAALDEANAALDTDALKALMVQVEADALAPDVVAAEWLASLD